MEYLKVYQEWLESDYFDSVTKKELLDIKEDNKEIQERFYKDLEFGTGGLRGILGAGTNRMNIYTVRKATQGLANYILKEGIDAAKRGVAIAYDSRRMSPEFANESALVLAANGIKAYVFESLRATPQLSFAIRHLGCIAGIVVTASHNPPEYNGFKVYWEDGAQVAFPKDEEIIKEVAKIKDYGNVKTVGKNQAIKEGNYTIIGKEVDDAYISELKKLVIDENVIKEQADDFTIIYTPLHGTGNIPVRRILNEVGFKNIEVVEEQEQPDGNFPTVEYPNPEDIKVFELAIKLGKEKNADIILATDPDADRLGVLAKNPEGKYVALTGNMIGVILLDYILMQKKKKNILPENGVVVESIVSTKMAGAIAKHFNIEIVETLTGFKYIGEKIKEYEASGEYEYLFGFEESYGFLIGTHARDKDAIVSTMVVCELAAYYKSKGLTLYEALLNLYKKYGYYKEDLRSLTLKGIEGIEKIQHILTELRNEPPMQLNNIKVIEARDYESQEIKNLLNGKIKSTGLPKSNVLFYVLEDESWICIRPSGTEPKIKFYFGVKGNSQEDADKKVNELSAFMMEKINSIIE